MVSRLGGPCTTDPAGVFGVVKVEDVPSFSPSSDKSWTPSVDRESSKSSEESSLQEPYTVVFNGSPFVVGVMRFGVRAVDVPSPMYCRISWVFSLHCDSVK